MNIRLTPMRLGGMTDFKNEFTVVNDCFQNEHNEEIGHYGQTLFIC